MEASASVDAFTETFSPKEESKLVEGCVDSGLLPCGHGQYKEAGMSRLFDVLFGCSHNHYTFPMSRKSAASSQPTGTYVVCLDCGREFPYDWREMRIMSGDDLTPVLTEAHAADRAA